MNDVNYSLLQHIKDGKAMSLKYNTKKMRFTNPNVIIVFSNKYPDTREFSEDRWMIFKINTKMGLEEVTIAQVMKKEGEDYDNKYRYNGNNKYYDSE